jgi:hypothetical protein
MSPAGETAGGEKIGGEAVAEGDAGGQKGDLDLAPIGNCTVSALIDRSGNYVWACVPRFRSGLLQPA